MKARRTLHSLGEGGWRLRRISQDTPQLAAGSFIDRGYYLSSHAEEEMLNDELARDDVENAILRGRIEKKLLEDLRGTRRRIEGPAQDGRLIHVMCRHKEDASLVVITVYALKEEP